MAAIRPCTGTTADRKAVEDTLILKEREIGVELDASGHYQIRQGDGKNKFFDLPIIVNNARYEEILTLTQGYMNTVNNFSKNMTEATNSANGAATTANNAASTANAAAKACQLRCGLLEFEQFCGQCELEHRCVQFLLISERLIKCSLYPTPQGENHSGYRVG